MEKKIIKFGILNGLQVSCSFLAEHLNVLLLLRAANHNEATVGVMLKTDNPNFGLRQKRFYSHCSSFLLPVKNSDFLDENVNYVGDNDRVIERVTAAMIQGLWIDS